MRTNILKSRCIGVEDGQLYGSANNVLLYRLNGARNKGPDFSMALQRPVINLSLMPAM